MPYRPGRPAEFDRDAVAARVESWLADRTLIAEICRNTARYFDEHLSPEAVGRYIVEQAAKV
jgi:hypothetical protein